MVTGDLTWRIGEAERRLGRVEEKAEDVRVLRSEFDHLAKSLNDLSEEVQALRHAVVTAAISFAISAVLVAVTTLLTFR